MAYDFPSSPSAGTEFVASTGRVYLYDNSGSWTTKGDTQTTNPFTNAFKYRTIYTRGYTGGGYKNSTPWRNVNRTQHAQIQLRIQVIYWTDHLVIQMVVGVIIMAIFTL